jgi:ATP-dependent RNA helicase DeaD
MSSTPPNPVEPLPSFKDLALSEAVARVLSDVGYETPSPIQSATIPPMLAGRDVVGQAQTGTGKTAAFALPILSRLNMQQHSPQALVLAPTRELAIQVAEAFQRYAAHIPGFHVLPIYGGQSYGPQLHGLKRGVHVVVGTPGRIIDHLERGSLDLSALTCLVLDEADEMLRMGFIDDVETILKKTPPKRQVALFSATMPAPIRRIAQTYQNDPVEITIKTKTSTAPNIRQRYWMVSGLHKLDALTRILEAEPFDAMIVFARTKQQTDELAEKLQARGLSAAAINGDIQQAQRERTIARLKDGQLDILVATDVAARGLDVERISHVLNYDIPTDAESYVHRVGRTGRAGRSGEAILFLTPRERHLLKAIERTTRQTIEPMELPSVEAVNDQRITRFMQRISDTLAMGDLGVFQGLIEKYEQQHNVPAVEIAAALAKMFQGDAPLLLQPEPKRRPERDTAPAPRAERTARPPRASSSSERPSGASDSGARIARDSVPRATRESTPTQRDRPVRDSRPATDRPPIPPARSSLRRADSGAPPARRERAPDAERDFAAPARERTSRSERPRPPEAGMETFRIEVGSAHGVKPANIVGAVANEAGLESRNIGRIDIRDDYSLLDLPEGMPSDIMRHLKKVWVSGQQLRISKWKEGDPAPARERAPSAKPRPFKPKRTPR